ncbi:MAG: glycosyl transferase family 2, partial [Pseudomonadota bacterium]
FETLVARMEAEPRIGTASGKPYMRVNGDLVSERRGDEMSAGMTKFYRTRCFQEIGGFVREVMWDAIDCHKARSMGWIAVSWDHPDLNFEHLRPMGSSQAGIHTGRRRHGFGQYFMGSDPIYYAATCVFRMKEPPYVTGGLSMFWGYVQSWLKGARRLDDAELVAFIRRYQRRALVVGKTRATAEVEAARASAWSGGGAGPAPA